MRTNEPFKTDKAIDAVFEPAEKIVEKTHEFIVEAKKASKFGLQKLATDSKTVLSTLLGLYVGDTETQRVVLGEIIKKLKHNP